MGAIDCAKEAGWARLMITDRRGQMVLKDRVDAYLEPVNDLL